MTVMKEYVYATIGDPMMNAHGEIFLARNEIVRCRDCVHYQPGYCKHFECMEHQISVVEDDYCSFGVRRNERS